MNVIFLLGSACRFGFYYFVICYWRVVTLMGWADWLVVASQGWHWVGGWFGALFL